MFSEEQIAKLRERVSEGMSKYRFLHTAEVEKMAARIGEIYAPDKLDVLRVAGLLHDITKELDAEGHCAILKRNGAFVSEEELLSVKTLHARSAAYLIEEEYPEFADPAVLSAVRSHTTGRADMSVCDMIIYLADYIDMSRKFEDCVALRSYFFSADFASMNENERLVHLYKTLIRAFDVTFASLIEKGRTVSVDSVKARNSLVLKLSKM